MKTLFFILAILFNISLFASESSDLQLDYDFKIDNGNSVIFKNPHYETSFVLGGGYQKIYFAHDKKTRNEVCIREGYSKSASKGNHPQRGNFSGWWEIATYKADKEGRFSFISNENIAYYNVIGHLVCIR